MNGLSIPVLLKLADVGLFTALMGDQWETQVSFSESSKGRVLLTINSSQSLFYPCSQVLLHKTVT